MVLHRLSRRGRFWLGVGAAAAPLPYLVLKALWLGGRTVGMADPAFFANPTYRVANLLTFLLDAAALTLALAFTFPWGRRVPAPLLLLPMWVGAGLLGTILLLVPVSLLVVDRAPQTAASADPLEPWVYQLVYACFALQGVLLLAAFTAYSRVRWPWVFAARVGAVSWPGRRLRRCGLALAAAAASLGLVDLAWARGWRAGLSGLAGRQDAMDRVTLGVYGLLAVLAAVALLGVLKPLSGRARFWPPFVTLWVATGSMCWWGLYFMAYSTADRSLTTPTLTAATWARVLVGVAAAALVLSTVPQLRAAAVAGGLCTDPEQLSCALDLGSVNSIGVSAPGPDRAG